MDSLIDIFNRTCTDKNSEYHNYCRQYDDLFKKYREDELSFLEIGIYEGGSLPVWREVFPNATKIVGADILESCSKYNDPDKNIFVEISDATTPEFAEKMGSFDIIVDDGSHTNEGVIKAFQNLFPLLNDNGLYVVEDTNCYKNFPHNNSKYPNHLEYFARFIPYLNQSRHDSHEGTRDHCADPWKILKKTDNVFEYSIDKIEFGCSYIAIHKKIREHWIKA
jgi:hypothetical protein